MKWGGGKKCMENTVDMTCNQNSGLLTRSHTVNTALPFFPLFFPLQSAAGRGGLHPPYHRGQLHSTPGTGGCSHRGSSLRSHCCHGCCRQARPSCRGSRSHRRSLWRVPASARHRRLRLRTTPAGRPTAASPGHLPELPGGLPGN